MKQCMILLAVLLAVLSGKAFCEAPKAPIKIAGIRAHMVYNNSGKVDPRNIIDNKEISLWNTIIGEGSAAGASSDTLVLVKVSGPTETYQQNKIDITVREGQRVLEHKVLTADIFNAQGFYFAPVLVNGTGCHPLTITAYVAGQATSKLVKTIPFQCGE